MTPNTFDPREIEHLNPATYEGIAKGDRVVFTEDVADDIKRGQVAIVTDLDDHAVYPVTVTVLKPAGQDVEGLPVKLTEIAVDR